MLRRQCPTGLQAAAEGRAGREAAHGSMRGTGHSPEEQSRNASSPPCWQKAAAQAQKCGREVPLGMMMFPRGFRMPRQLGACGRRRAGGDTHVLSLSNYMFPCSW